MYPIPDNGGRIAFLRDDSSRSIDNATGETGQDRGKGNTALEVRDVPVGRGGCHTKPVRSDPRPHCPAGDSTADCRWLLQIDAFIHSNTKHSRGIYAPMSRLMQEKMSDGSHRRRTAKRQPRNVVRIVTNLTLREPNVRLANIRSLEVFLAQAIWEISAEMPNSY